MQALINKIILRVDFSEFVSRIPEESGRNIIYRIKYADRSDMRLGTIYAAPILHPVQQVHVIHMHDSLKHFKMPDWGNKPILGDCRSLIYDWQEFGGDVYCSETGDVSTPSESDLIRSFKEDFAILRRQKIDLETINLRSLALGYCLGRQAPNDRLKFLAQMMATPEL